jgi:hypothetical protein
LEPNDPRVDYKSPSSFVELVETKEYLGKELEEFESTFVGMKL